MKFLVLAGLMCVGSAVFALPNSPSKGEDKDRDNKFYMDRCKEGSNTGMHTRMVCELMRNYHDLGLFIGALCNSDIPQGPGRELCERFVPRPEEYGKSMRVDMEEMPYMFGDDGRAENRGDEINGDPGMLRKLIHAFGNRERNDSRL